MESLYDIELNSITGQPVKLSDYKGKVLLIVNIASRCGQTPQLAELEKLYEKYRSRGFEVLGFPSNDFNQEPKAGEQIQEFCTRNYGVTFPIFAKHHVKGRYAQALYKWLARNAGWLFITIYPVWNFQKYLVDRNGRYRGVFNPWRRPGSAKIAEEIEKCLTEQPVDKEAAAGHRN